MSKRRAPQRVRELPAPSDDLARTCKEGSPFAREQIDASD